MNYVRPKVAGTVRTVPGLDNFLEVPRRDPFAEKRGRGKRGRAGVRGLSSGSRRRYLKALLPGMPAVVEGAASRGAALLSLTYGQDAERFGVEGEEATRHRKALYGYLTRRGWCGMYCREYQERQALHWHAVILATSPAASVDDDDLARWWLRLTGERGSSLQARLRWGARVDWIRPESAGDQLAAYLAKDTSKGGQRTEAVLTDHETGEVHALGRPWGYIDRKAWEARSSPIESKESGDAQLFADRQIAAAFVREPPDEAIERAQWNGGRGEDVYVHAPVVDIGRQAKWVRTGDREELGILARWPDGTGDGKRRRNEREVSRLLGEVARRWPWVFR